MGFAAPDPPECLAGDETTVLIKVRFRREAVGFCVEEIAIVPRPTPLDAGVDAWLDNFADDFFAPLAPADRPVAKREIVDLLEPILKDETGLWIADYVRLRFKAVLAG
jgi:hypothetical protein